MQDPASAALCRLKRRCRLCPHDELSKNANSLSNLFSKKLFLPGGQVRHVKIQCVLEAQISRSVLQMNLPTDSSSQSCSRQFCVSHHKI